MVYLLARKWRSAINIASMRYFESYEDLEAHVKQHPVSHWSGGEPWHAYRVYKDGRDAEPLTLKENRKLGIR